MNFIINSIERESAKAILIKLSINEPSINPKLRNVSFTTWIPKSVVDIENLKINNSIDIPTWLTKSWFSVNTDPSIPDFARHYSKELSELSKKARMSEIETSNECMKIVNKELGIQQENEKNLPKFKEIGDNIEIKLKFIKIQYGKEYELNGWKQVTNINTTRWKHPTFQRLYIYMEDEQNNLFVIKSNTNSKKIIDLINAKPGEEFLVKGTILDHKIFQNKIQNIIDGKTVIITKL